MKQIVISDDVVKQFPDEKQYLFKHIITNKIKVSLEHNFYKIKPVRVKNKKCYEMKIVLDKQSYRIAFELNKEKINVFFISSILVKKIFDKEVNKLCKNK
ncbi:hypothetical protein KI123_002454 [Enterococcus faecalis]|uniref:hypothetical protein n=1 Tax=Enterococcus faecalis TaxID=1351 RepID=UPI000CF0E224|nr:hypothetical protein [Enterococcus faecalis]EHQ8839825.1 hypothetical protein [Enterococcus faecalis]PQB37993.1 hypothetical protein CUM82_12965 [Enterococcus faecalis]